MCEETVMCCDKCESELGSAWKRCETQKGRKCRKYEKSEKVDEHSKSNNGCYMCGGGVGSVASERSSNEPRQSLRD